MSSHVFTVTQVNRYTNHFAIASSTALSAFVGSFSPLRSFWNVLDDLL